ncbi:cytochrome C biosynthesis protein [Paraferrimonas sedimenticola]|uniref:Cytochrome c biosynthesis protein n=1 Tax=Paraferrimonas sedimenticola TaxID=375674 RepID=A0AA37RZ92_9GAMM|nr:cytochrome C biosynthesis protein [Paraferrimonas sedimenticola]GLP97921.1 cytochrome c biosynthesis protein [Paraferrimonas sedimenticola]
MKQKLVAFFLLAIALVSGPALALDNPQQVWYQNDTQGQVEKVNLYFFWSETCPHCREAHPFIDEIPNQLPWVELKDYLITEPGTREKLMKIGELTGNTPRSVPYFAVCGEAIVGYNSHEVTGEYIIDRLKACYRGLGGTPAESTPIATDAMDEASLLAGTCDSATDSGGGDCGLEFEPAPSVQPVEIPLIGAVQPERMSLPVLTLVLAGVDAFNPCAFFVLLFLLSIMVNAGSRRRMLLVGGIFVFFSGFIYFIFMTAWLNLFQLLGGGDGGIIITGAGLLALVAAVINIKDFFWGKGDVSLSMSVENRGGLIKRMGKLSKASSLATMIAGTTVLAILANAYELLCTAGFPMIFTSVLSMSDLTSTERYMYLVAYNIIYVIPLAAIVIVFAATLGKRKLTEKEGEVLKLMSGIMMLGLGSMLVFNPMALQNAVFSIGLILCSILLTFVITKAKRAYLARK